MTSLVPSSLPNPVNIFISYSHHDEELRDELVMHLANLKRQGQIQTWSDRNIEAGAEWNTAIKHQLETAQIILLLISSRFLSSDRCYDVEMQQAIQRHNTGSARVIPIILKPCDWQGSPFSELNILPKDAKPITQWNDKDEAFLNIVQSIRNIIESLQGEKSAEKVLLQKLSPLHQIPLITRVSHTFLLTTLKLLPGEKPKLLTYRHSSKRVVELLRS